MNHVPASATSVTSATSSASSHTGAEAALLRALREIAERQKIAPAIAAHLEHYFDDADVAGFGEAAPEELHGAALQHYRLGLTRPAGQSVVAFYTPDFDRHGWHSPHTVIDVVTDDMPFLIDSITMAVHRHGLSIHKLMHPLLGIERDATGALLRSAERGAADTRTESWIHLEVDHVGDRVGDSAQLDALRADISSVLADVRAAVEDHLPMRESVATAIADLEQSTAAENQEVIAFLRWIADENFVFLGYAHYHADQAAGELVREGEGGLGLLRSSAHPRFGRCLEGIPGNLAELAGQQSALTLVAKVPGIDADEFAKIAKEAEMNCPVSKLLDCEITLEHSLEN